MCQHDVHRVSQLVRDKWPYATIIHHMDDELIIFDDELMNFELILIQRLPKVLAFLQNTVAMQGMLISSNKIQLFSPWKYLGYSL